MDLHGMNQQLPDLSHVGTPVTADVFKIWEINLYPIMEL